MDKPKIISRRSVVLGVAMAVTSAGAYFAMPKAIVVSQSQMPDLETLIPPKFGNWTIDKDTVPLTISPELAQKLGNLYDRTLSRTYVNAVGQRIMLSIAYGGNQSRALQLHRPEVCYSAQGFRLSGVERGRWEFPGVIIPTMHMVGALGGRIEPVTYWMRIGDEIARGWYEQNAVRLRYGLTGAIPDGLLFRISNIEPDSNKAYALQREFMKDLISSMSPSARDEFFGTVAQRSAKRQLS